MQNSLDAFGRLLSIMDDLRAQCPWDKKQTMESLSHLTIEEVYELYDAIMDKNLDEVKKELGDIMLHLVFYAKIASETGEFTITEVLHSVCDKLVERHPHIYGDVKASTVEEVKTNWEKIKLKSGKTSVLEGVPKSLPALVKAIRIQEKARGVGFDWPDEKGVWEKVKEEWNELEDARNKENQADMEEEFGDLMFSLVNLSRFMNINPEEALAKANLKFINRFQWMETTSRENGKAFSDLTINEMDQLWNQAKGHFKGLS